ncbi:MAG TPA: hypothetical protein VE863_22530 [Pyrinomonadaceae bacterium]|nr:hypothetical protein [Pyrinomonadaceae bacterium]
MREKTPNYFSSTLSNLHNLRILLFFIFLPAAVAAQAPSPTPTDQTADQNAKRDPVENADDFRSKLTFGVYFTKDGQSYDVNLRHQFGPNVTAWIAGFADTGGSKLIRIGGQYDYHKKWFHFVPSGEVETTKGVSVSLYSEWGYNTIAIAGYSRTNLKTFFDLFWDPGDSVTLGVGHKINSYDRIQAFTVFDVRLHTEQENTHVLYRHKLNRNNGITFDGFFKTGHLDNGKFIQTAGAGIYYDRPKWFWKLYFDPHVNYTAPTMVRTGIGVKF